MKRSPKQQIFYAFSIVCALAPFVFGFIRIHQRNDYRMLWMAFASFVGMVIVVAIAGSRTNRPDTGVIASMSFVLATILAAITGRLLGATALAGILGVGIVFGLFWAASVVFNLLSQPQNS